ncbi:hypothetical protein [Ruegeria sp. R14_0]|uniref:glucosamine inositolphosphorylceramide transferase family protein n=1 Tax=Ruegeria sp. R14_0 TaxID=2821100 RepID=UPI001ADB14AF|nr:hypothetical protein [Ruegeria sp. R14_0]MBO9446704.1 hypothetical protein [Ruegeria sp. R14_0]
MPVEQLRIAFVTPPEGLRLMDWQALLIDRLRRDERFEITGQIIGGDERQDPPGTLLTRCVKLVEHLAAAHRILPYDTQPAEDYLTSLPFTERRADIALSLGSVSLTEYQLAQIVLAECSLTFGGMADPFNAAMAKDAARAPRIGVSILTRSYENPAPCVWRETSYNRKPGAVLTGAFVAEKSVLFLAHALAGLAQDQTLVNCNELTAPSLKPEFDSAWAYAQNFVSVVTDKLRTERLARSGKARDFWQLGRSKGSISGFHPGKATALSRSAFVMADPFLFEHEGQHWVFYEAMNADNHDGWIEVAHLNGDHLEHPTTALKRPYHLSYPFVFRDGDAIYMMPETQAARRLEIWRATRFPDKWELHATAFEGQHLAESSLFRDDNDRWWLLTNLSDHYAFQDHSSELYLFEIDGPDLTQIKPHPDNPVVFGSASARNAGAVIRQGNRLFRPSQNNSHGVYGYGLNIMEILRLDETGYEERLIRQFTPEDRPGVSGMHHLSVAGDQIVMDWSGAE